ncbi:MAG: DUF4367 domain-containing protein [Oscillospiraceae bacterium]|nr:DUF4367 domain-containing protein [Oscillospiraceae bacterium]
MFENLLDEVLTEYYAKELLIYSTVPEHKFSLKHRRAMKKIFKVYDHNTEPLRSKTVQSTAYGFSEHKFRLTPKRLLVLVIVILLATLAGCAATYFISQSFRGEIYSDNTELFPINLENCPTTIEEKYFFPEIPEGFEIYKTNSTPFFESTSYKNKQTGQTITFSQHVKEGFDSIHFNTEKMELVEIEINGHYGLFLDVSAEENIAYCVIWDNGDYILEIGSNLDKNSLLNLAKSAKILEN